MVGDADEQPAADAHPEMGELLRVDEAQDRLVQGDAGGDEDHEHDEEAGDLLGAEAGRALQLGLGAPFLIAGALKSVYDIGLYALFHDVPVEA